MKKITYILLATFALSSCQSEMDKLAEKRAELKEKEKEFSELRAEISDIKKEIDKLDTTVRVNAVAVRSEPIKIGEFKNPFRIQGLVESDRNVLISPEVPGTLKRVYVKVGQRVSAGQVIARIDGSAAASQIAELEGRLSLAKTNYEKLERLWNQNIGSEIQYLQAKDAYEGLQKSIVTANTQLSKYTLRSPISGTVDDVMVNEGELVGSLTGGPIARIVTSSNMKVKGNVSEKYINMISKGQKVEVEFPAIGVKSTERIATVGGTVDVNNRTFPVYITPSISQSKIKPNMLAIITAYDYVNNGVISVPTKLIRNDGRGDYIMIVEEKGDLRLASKRMLEVEKKFADYAVIKSGLEAGDEIITEGYTNVINGDQVKIITDQ